MAFWRGESLSVRLPSLVTPFDPARIDCAAYTLTLGGEAFVTADLPDGGSAVEGVKLTLTPGQQVRIAPGQFAFLLTGESVEVPADAIAFISMKARYKFRGLINVSGFHVDPGFKGHLVFSVYNAGPSPVVISQGAPLFLIWYATLDGTTSMLYQGQSKSISDDLISNMSGQVFSPMELGRRIGRLTDKAFSNSEKMAGMDSQLKIAMGAGVAVVTLAILPALLFLYGKQVELRDAVQKLQPIGQAVPLAVAPEVKAPLLSPPAAPAPKQPVLHPKSVGEKLLVPGTQ